MKALTKYLKEEHGGKKFMDLPADQRNQKEFVIASRAALEELKEAYGADEILIYLHKGMSTYQGFSREFSIESTIALFKTIKERLTSTIPRDVAQAISYRPENPELEDGDMGDAVARAMEYALKGLPPEAQEIAYTRMQKALEKGGLDAEDFPEVKEKARKGGEEDELLNDLLK